MSRSNVKFGLSKIICHFEELEDPRSPINRHHPLPSILTISLMGILAGSDGPTAISRWAVAKKDLLIQTLDLPHGIPSRDVIRRVLSALKVDAFQSCFACWLNSLRDAAKEKAGVNAELKDHVAIDGKTMKGSHNRAKGLGPMHMVSAWLSEFGLTLAQVATDVKSNEITIGVVVYNSLNKGEVRIDIRYFISSFPLGIEQFSKAVRRHWGIETTCHWSLDVTYGEDGLRTRQRTIAENLAWLRRFTLSLSKQHPGKDSLAMKRRICGWSDDFLMEVLGIKGT